MNKLTNKALDLAEPFLKALFKNDLTVLFPLWILAVAGLGGSTRLQMDGSLFWRMSFSLPIVIYFIGITTLGVVVPRLVNLYHHRSIDEFINANRPIIIAGAIGLLLTASAGVTAAALLLIAVFIYFVAESYLRSTGVLTTILKPFVLGLIAAVLYMSGWGAGGGELGAGLIHATAYGSIFIGIAFLKGYYPEIVQKSEHERIGKVLLPTVSVSLLFIVFAAYLSMGNDDPVLTTACAIIIPFNLVAIVYLRVIDILRIVRYSILILIFFAGALYPFIFIPAIALFYLSRIHHHRQHGHKYPTLEGPLMFISTEGTYSPGSSEE